LIASEKEVPDVSRCVKVCMGLYHDTRRRKTEDILWNLDVESSVEFLYPQPPEEEEEEEEEGGGGGGQEEEESLDKL
jgi:hypothetical protein